MPGMLNLGEKLETFKRNFNIAIDEVWKSSQKKREDAGLADAKTIEEFEKVKIVLGESDGNCCLR